jgi:asparagine synthase (glutamine-hydrolysing)
MCRIAGIVSDCTSGPNSVKLMLQSMKNGGPDDEGVFEDNGLCFGHKRLSILDLSDAGHQPMPSASGDIWITYNGEIYNFNSIKRELIECGISFKSNTDTEVIIYAYKQWGVSSFAKFEGIFAFALYDKPKNKLLLVRDSFGVKPLYYFIKDKTILFASEIRAFKAFDTQWPENPDWKIVFLAFGSIPHPFSTLKDVFSLSPGNVLTIDLTTANYHVSPFSSESVCHGYLKNKDGALLKIQSAVTNSLEKNLVADLEIALFLSGGIDSSILAIIGDIKKKNLSSISINFDEKEFDEGVFQQEVLKFTCGQNKTFKVSKEMFCDHLHDFFNSMDQPSVDGLNTYFIAKYASERGFKVALSGLGADEVFGGYNSISRIKWLKSLRKLPAKRLISKLLGLFNRSFERLCFLEMKGPIWDYLFLRGIYTVDQISILTGENSEVIKKVIEKVSIRTTLDSNDPRYALFLESNIYLRNQLLRDADNFGMWHGLEIRVPFLDIRLVDAVDSIHHSIRFSKNHKKHLLKDSFKNVLPPKIANRNKQGFTFPFNHWLKDKPLLTKLIPQEGKSINVINDFIQGKSHWSKAWALATMEQFERRQKDKISISSKEAAANFQSTKAQPTTKFRYSRTADVYIEELNSSPNISSKTIRH